MDRAHSTSAPRVGIVQCFEARCVRVFGPYARGIGVEKREGWNRRAENGWRYEVLEDLDAKTSQARAAGMRSEVYVLWNLATMLAADTQPMYVVREDESGRIVETLLGPIPCRLARTTQFETGALAHFARCARASALFNAPPVTGRHAILRRPSEWAAGRALSAEARASPLPPRPNWPSEHEEPVLAEFGIAT